MHHPNYLSMNYLGLCCEGEDEPPLAATAGSDQEHPVRPPVGEEGEVGLLPPQHRPEPGLHAGHGGEGGVGGMQARQGAGLGGGEARVQGADLGAGLGYQGGLHGVVDDPSPRSCGEVHGGMVGLEPLLYIL